MASTHSERPLVAVTGALSGVGYELTRQFAQHGYDVLAVAEDDDVACLVDDVAKYGCQLKPLRLDLGTLEGQRAFLRAVQSEFRPLDALAINASVGVCGEFARETSLDEELHMIGLDVLGTVRITKALLPDMLKRRQGAVLLASSTAALQPTPYEAVYAASKAFLLSFAGSLQAELCDTGVSVSALIAGEDPYITARDGFRSAMGLNSLERIPSSAA